MLFPFRLTNVRFEMGIEGETIAFQKQRSGQSQPRTGSFTILFAAPRCATPPCPTLPLECPCERRLLCLYSVVPAYDIAQYKP